MTDRNFEKLRSITNNSNYTKLYDWLSLPTLKLSLVEKNIMAFLIRYCIYRKSTSIETSTEYINDSMPDVCAKTIKRALNHMKELGFITWETEVFKPRKITLNISYIEGMKKKWDTLYAQRASKESEAPLDQGKPEVTGNTPPPPAEPKIPERVQASIDTLTDFLVKQGSIQETLEFLDLFVELGLDRTPVEAQRFIKKQAKNNAQKIIENGKGKN